MSNSSILQSGNTLFSLVSFQGHLLIGWWASADWIFARRIAPGSNLKSSTFSLMTRARTMALPTWSVGRIFFCHFYKKKTYIHLLYKITKLFCQSLKYLNTYKNNPKMLMKILFITIRSIFYTISQLFSCLHCTEFKQNKVQDHHWFYSNKYLI